MGGQGRLGEIQHGEHREVRSESCLLRRLAEKVVRQVIIEHRIVQGSVSKVLKRPQTTRRVVLQLDLNHAQYNINVNVFIHQFVKSHELFFTLP